MLRCHTRQSRRPICDEARRVIGALAVFRGDTDGDFQLRDAEALELLSRKATQIIRTSFDPVTGLLTAAAFNAQTAAKLSSPVRGTGPHGLLYIDIDQLNVVNENHGMHVGDEVIQGIAAAAVAAHPRRHAHRAGRRRPVQHVSAGLRHRACGARRGGTARRSHPLERRARRQALARKLEHRGFPAVRSRFAPRPCHGGGGARLPNREGTRPQPGRGVLRQ